MKQYHSFFKILLSCYLILTLIVFFLTIINIIIYIDTKKFIVSSASLNTLSEKKEVAIVLGASVYGEKLSKILRKRVDVAIDLYKKGLVKEILMSGDGIQKNYNETMAMKKFALRHGVPEEAIFTDIQGFNTYTSILRAKKIYQIKNAYIISQDFHIGRAVWIARRMGIEMTGVSIGQLKFFDYYTFREILARPKDFFQTFFLSD